MGRGAPSRGWAALLAALVAAVIFAPSLANGFAYDDVAVIVNDPRVHTLGDLRAIFTSGYWGDDQLAIYRPLTTLSFALDWSVGFGSATWFHLVNVILHAGVTALVVLLLTRWFGIGAALAGGLLFAVHPVHVEAVANVVGRSELLAAIAVLGGLLLWCHQPPSRAAAVRTAGVGTLLALGLAAKESALILLPLIVVTDLAEARLVLSRPGEWLRRNAPVLGAMGLVVAVWAGARIAVLGGMAPARVDAVFDVANDTPARIFTALQAWPVWARLLFAPVTLLADYAPQVLMPALTMTRSALMGAMLVLAFVAGGIFALAHGRVAAGLALLWFPIAILPVSNLLVPTGIIVAERALYLPSVAVSFGVAIVGESWSRRPDRLAILRRPAMAGFALVLALFAARSLIRIPAWASTDSVFAAQMADRPDSFRAQWHFAREARSRGDVAEANRRYGVAVSLWPYRQKLNIEAATYAVETGRLQGARDIAAFAASLHPEDLAVVRLLAATSLDLGDSTAARQTVRTGLTMHPDDDVLQRMARALNMDHE